MNRRFKLTLLAAGVAAAGVCATSAQAATVTLPLGSIHTGDDIENYFNGGTDSTNQSGTNLGIGFSANATAQSAGDSGSTGDGRFENNPSGQSQILYFSSSNSTASYINYATGFSALSFNYSFSNNTNPDTTEYAYLYSGLSGTGTVLATLALTPASATVACTTGGDSYCTWSAALTTGSFGTAESVLFATTAAATTTAPPVTLTEFDGVTLTPVPIPAALWLMISGLGGLLPLARRRVA
jgi:hypothetical protein